MSVLENGRLTPVGAYAPRAWKDLSPIGAAVAVPLVPAVGEFCRTEEELYFVAAGRFPDRGYAGQGHERPLAALAPGAFPTSSCRGRACRSPGRWAACCSSAPTVTTCAGPSGTSGRWAR
ncbi:hypothetical protein ACIHFD_29795 [Nonomuraea sp. NPDC051941]|uniref:hypothetical protein n=1 Tax=Nonomuraea sp. NPDC051941 TaxID=3364373 RepID=UPI0037C8EB18